jgi:hypothetical protein
MIAPLDGSSPQTELELKVSGFVHAPGTGPYSELDESSPQTPPSSSQFKLHVIAIHSFTHRSSKRCHFVPHT